MTTDHANLAADVVLFAADPPAVPSELHVLLIQRGWAPYAGCWALPGGYVERAETFEDAARRELTEETGLTAPACLDRVGVYDAPNRDPRGRVVSVAFVGRTYGMPAPTAGDDAKAARWVSVDSVLTGEQPAAFDHAEIIAAAVNHVRFNGWWCHP